MFDHKGQLATRCKCDESHLASLLQVFGGTGGGPIHSKKAVKAKRKREEDTA